MGKLACVLVCALLNIGAAVAAYVDASSVITFGTAIKGGTIGNTEQTLFEHTLNPQSTHGVVTLVWWTGGGNGPQNGLDRIRFYVDGEANASVDYELFMGLGIGWGKYFGEVAPWGTKNAGQVAFNGGFYHTYRIPFQSSLKVSVLPGMGVDPTKPFWFIIRGAENLPITLGDLVLPTTSKMQLIINDNVSPGQGDYLTLVEIPPGKGGALFQVTMALFAGGPGYLEGMVRAYIDGASDPILLSSGTEDYFLSADYFDSGEYRLPLSGATHLNFTGGARVSAYRFHDQDPIIFHNGFKLTWRCGEGKTGKITGQPFVGTTYTWVYTW